MTYDRAARLKKQAHVRLDRFGIFQLGRDERLSALDRWLLVTLSMLCDYKSGDYFGTITDLSEDTGATRRAIGDALDRLHEKKLVQIVTDFGPKIQGHVRVLALDRLLVDVEKVNRAEQRETRTPHVRRYERGNRAQTARISRANRAVSARIDAVAPPATCDDADAQGSKRRREQGNTDSRDNVEADALARLERDLGAEVIKIRPLAS